MEKRFDIRPHHIYRICLIFQFVLLLISIVPVFDISTFMLYLFVVFSLTLRWRFPVDAHIMVIDCLLVCIAIAYKGSGAPFLALYVFYFSFNNKVLLSLITVVVTIFITQEALRYGAIGVIAFGYMLSLWQKESIAIRKQQDDLRQKIYHMGQTEVHLLQDYHNTRRISQLTERQRIAEILHDNLGHELTAAHLTVKAIGTLLENEDTQRALEFQMRASQRLESALTQLKTTVEQLEITHIVESIDFFSLFEDFVYPIEISQIGNLTLIPLHLRQLLYISIKEALTNITKHARPTKVTAVIECTDSIVRIIMENDGILRAESTTTHHGLHYMRKRIEAIGGSVSIAKSETFKIIITLPLRGPL